MVIHVYLTFASDVMLQLFDHVKNLSGESGISPLCEGIARAAGRSNQASIRPLRSSGVFAHPIEFRDTAICSSDIVVTKTAESMSGLLWHLNGLDWTGRRDSFPV